MLCFFPTKLGSAPVFRYITVRNPLILVTLFYSHFLSVFFFLCVCNFDEKDLRLLFADSETLKKESEEKGKRSKGRKGGMTLLRSGFATFLDSKHP